MTTLDGVDALSVKYFLTVRSFGCNWTKKTVSGRSNTTNDEYLWLFAEHTHAHTRTQTRSEPKGTHLCVYVCEFVDSSAYEGCPSINGGFYLYEKIQGV